jgi:tetratricopeptide (TPR) repeat protein
VERTELVPTGVDPQDLLQFVAGDLAALDRILTAPHDQLLKTAEAMPPLVVEPGAVLRVLDALRRGKIRPEQAQQWASFVRCGFAPSASSDPIRPLPIDYPAEYEDDIVEVVGRLDELGDIIDGEIGPEEMDAWEERLCREVLTWVPATSREAAASLHQLGMLAQRRGDYPEAEAQYRRSLAIFEELGDRAGLARSYHQLGILAQDRGDHPEAEAQ